MNKNRRLMTRLALAGGAWGILPGLHAQEAYPSKPIRIVVPTSAGGGLDIVARLLSEKLAAGFRQPVIIENRTGASSTIGTRYVALSPPDGHTMLLMANTFASTPAIMANAGYDPLKDFAGVTLVDRMPMVVVVSANGPYKSLNELITATRNNPGQISYASSGAGSTAHFAAERFAHQLGLKLVHVPYRGTGEAAVDVLSGRIDFLFDQIGTSLPQIKAARLRALAITSEKRSKLLPDVPTFADAGIKDFEDYTWMGLMVPAAVPADIIARINSVVVKVLQMPEVKESLESRGLEAAGSTTAEFNAYVRSEVTRLTRLARESNIRAE